MTTADYAAGVLQGAVDAATGAEHSSRAWVAERPGRETEAIERWASGQPARNQFERDTYHAQETRIAFDHPALRGPDREMEAGS